ncbi:hypothetical protein BMT54_10335 [Pasteurellaceae bacterium 15-036681]|nr:hypothetical protein BMT54_10335 [Pasteurellaceae bacterium 15-036681]
MKKHNIALVILMSLGIAACSSGGSSSHTTKTVKETTAIPSTISGENVVIKTGNTDEAPPATPTQPNPEPITPAQPDPEPITPAQPNPEPITPTQVSYDGLALDSLKGTSAVIESTTNEKAHYILVDGKQVSLIPSTSEAIINTERFYSDERGIISGSHVQYVDYGLIASLDGGKLFFIGEKTKDMPQSGSFTYRGNAIMHQAKIDGAVENSTYDPKWVSELIADFDKKELYGELFKPNTKSAASVYAQIQGNEFEGTTGSDVYTKGAFFGPNAEELSGIVKSPTHKFTGVFGAAKQ